MVCVLRCLVVVSLFAVGCASIVGLDQDYVVGTAGAGAAGAAENATGGTGTTGGTGPTGGTGGASAAGGTGGTGAAGGTGATGSGGAGGSAAVNQAGDLLVVLDARDASAGSATWQNVGTLGDFAERGNPSVGQYQGVTAVQFNGVDHAYEGPTTPSTLEGSSDRSIEVWVCNPALAGEETLVAWSNRGGPANTNLTFNYGNNAAFGAVGHWANDLGWGAGGPPAADQWHLLTYVYDGTDAIVYADGAEKNRMTTTLATHAGYSINIATQRDGALEYAHAGSLWIATVRVHSEALTPSQVSANFDLERNRFGL